jgi:hypothetical protein
MFILCIKQSADRARCDSPSDPRDVETIWERRGSARACRETEVENIVDSILP